MRKSLSTWVTILVVALASLGMQEACSVAGPSCPLLLPVFSSQAAATDSIPMGCPYRFVDENGDTTTVGGLQL